MSSNSEENLHVLPLQVHPGGRPSARITRVHQAAERVVRDVSPPEDDAAIQRALDKEALAETLRSRTVIGQAMGLLMRDLGVTGDAAFAHLVRVSSHTNVKVRDLATRMVAEAEEGLQRQD